MDRTNQLDTSDICSGIVRADPDTRLAHAANSSIAGIAPTDPEALLTREMTSRALTEVGFPVATKTLATKATRGGGPPYMLFSNRALYRWGDALAWARAELTAPRRTTSEADASPATAMRTSK